MSTGSGGSCRDHAARNGRAAVRTATPRPAHAANTMPLVSLWVTPQITDASIAPPSSGRPGSRL